jgi:hypothetical protein
MRRKNDRCVDGDDVLDAVRREAEEDLQAVGQDHVRKQGAGREERCRDGGEAQPPATLVLVQPGGHEAPQLVEPHRRRQDQPRHGCDLHLEHERVGDTRQRKDDLTALGAGLLDHRVERCADPREEGVVVDPADHHADADGESGLDQT